VVEKSAFRTELNTAHCRGIKAAFFLCLGSLVEIVRVQVPPGQLSYHLDMRFGSPKKSESQVSPDLSSDSEDTDSPYPCLSDEEESDHDIRCVERKFKSWAFGAIWDDHIRPSLSQQYPLLRLLCSADRLTMYVEVREGGSPKELNRLADKFVAELERMPAQAAQACSMSLKAVRDYETRFPVKIQYNVALSADQPSTAFVVATSYQELVQAVKFLQLGEPLVEADPENIPKHREVFKRVIFSPHAKSCQETDAALLLPRPLLGVQDIRGYVFAESKVQGVTATWSFQEDVDEEKQDGVLCLRGPKQAVDQHMSQILRFCLQWSFFTFRIPRFSGPLNPEQRKAVDALQNGILIETAKNLRSKSAWGCSWEDDVCTVTAKSQEEVKELQASILRHISMHRDILGKDSELQPSQFNTIRYQLAPLPGEDQSNELKRFQQRHSICVWLNQQAQTIDITGHNTKAAMQEMMSWVQEEKDGGDRSIEQKIPGLGFMWKDSMQVRTGPWMLAAADSVEKTLGVCLEWSAPAPLAVGYLSGEIILPYDTKVQVWEGDMRHSRCEGIVIPLSGGIRAGGLVEIIGVAAGREFEKDHSNMMRTRSSVRIGEAVALTAGEFKMHGVKNIICAPGPVWKPEATEAEKLQLDGYLSQAIVAALQTADDRNLSSLAMPFLSTGNFGFPVARACKVIMKAVEQFFAAEPNSSIRNVLLIEKDGDKVEIMTKLDAFQRKQQKPSLSGVQKRAIPSSQYTVMTITAACEKQAKAAKKAFWEMENKNEPSRKSGSSQQAGFVRQLHQWSKWLSG